MARRFFIDPDQVTKDRPLIAGADAHHLRDVLRVRPGDQITVFDGTGADYRAEIAALTPDGIRIALKAPVHTRRESPLCVTVAQAYLKDKKMDALVRQLTELGITRWFPFTARRSVALPDEKRLQARYQRWKKISHEAVKQCGRSLAMTIDPLKRFDDVLAEAPGRALKLVFWENVADAPSLDRLCDLRPAEVVLMIGPEGGFERSEIDRAVASGFSIVSMGPRILRAETAALAACVMTQTLFGDMSQKILDNAGGV